MNVRSFLRNFFLSRRVEADLDNEVRLHLELMFGRALAQPGVAYIPAHSPQAKGPIERLWGTFRDRLTSELRLAGTTDLPTASDFLLRFLPDFHRAVRVTFSRCYNSA